MRDDGHLSSASTLARPHAQAGDGAVLPQISPLSEARRKSAITMGRLGKRTVLHLNRSSYGGWPRSQRGSARSPNGDAPACRDGQFHPPARRGHGGPGVVSTIPGLSRGVPGGARHRRQGTEGSRPPSRAVGLAQPVEAPGEQKGRPTHENEGSRLTAWSRDLVFSCP